MIEGENVQLRTVKEKDLEELYFFFDSIRLKGEYLPQELLSEQKFKNKFYETGFWEEAEGHLVVVSKEKIAGAVWYKKRAGFESLGLYFYMFRAEDRGKGLMTEALSLFTRYLFETRKVERLEILIPNYSKAALRIAEKGRFHFEGILRSALFHRGKYIDLCLYSLIRSD